MKLAWEWHDFNNTISMLSNTELFVDILVIFEDLVYEKSCF